MCKIFPEFSLYIKGAETVANEGLHGVVFMTGLNIYFKII